MAAAAGRCLDAAIDLDALEADALEAEHRLLDPRHSSAIGSPPGSGEPFFEVGVAGRVRLQRPGSDFELVEDALQMLHTVAGESHNMRAMSASL